MTTIDQQLAKTFVELADTLVTDFDLVDFLAMLAERSRDLLGAEAAGVVMADPMGQLHVMASSSQNMRIMELFEIQNDEGPCMDAYSTHRQVVNGSLGSESRWPEFAGVAGKAGFTTAHAFPLRLRDECLGAVNILDSHDRVLAPDLVVIAQALADAATIGILQERVIRHKTELAQQLQEALNSRIVVEQAKGVLAERNGIETGEAFDLMRRYARRNNESLSNVARRLTTGELRTVTE